MRQQVNIYLSMIFIGVFALGAGYLIVKVSHSADLHFMSAEAHYEISTQ